MTTVAITGNSLDGRLRRSGATNWAATLASTPVSTTTGTITLHKSNIAATDYIDRGYFSFDVSPYLSETIISASIDIYYLIKNTNAVHYNYRLYYNDFGAALTSADLGGLSNPASALFLPTAAGTHQVINLTDPQSIITYNGKLEMVVENESVAPSNGWQSSIEIASSEHATVDFRPVLTLVYASLNVSAILNARKE